MAGLPYVKYQPKEGEEGSVRLLLMKLIKNVSAIDVEWINRIH